MADLLNIALALAPSICVILSLKALLIAVEWV